MSFTFENAEFLFNEMGKDEKEGFVQKMKVKITVILSGKRDR